MVFENALRDSQDEPDARRGTHSDNLPSSVPGDAEPLLAPPCTTRLRHRRCKLSPQALALEHGGIGQQQRCSTYLVWVLAQVSLL